MSEQNDPRVPFPDDSDEARTEYGRQIAMDSILEAAMGAGEGAADQGKVIPMRRRRWRGVAAAAVVVLGAGAALWAARDLPTVDHKPEAMEFAGSHETDRPHRDAPPEATTGEPVLRDVEMVDARTAQQAMEDRLKSLGYVGGTPEAEAGAASAERKGGAVIDLAGLGQGTGDPANSRLPLAKGLVAPQVQYGQPPTTHSIAPNADPADGASVLFLPPKGATRATAPVPPSAAGPSTPGPAAPSSGMPIAGVKFYAWNSPAPGRREGYDHIVENVFKSPTEHPLSTFSIDVDTASYSNVRDLLRRGQLPPADAVRIEEMVNYFDYVYAPPTGEHPVGIHVDMAAAPWAPQHRLVRIGLQARNLHERRPNANLVFLIDVSGSMQPANKLPLLKQVLAKMVDALGDDDRVALVTYAGNAGLVLDSTAVGDEEKVHAALARLNAGGSTNGGAGIQLAYKVARENFVKGGINRVILASDGDFNVGTTDRGSLVRLIESERESGVFLSVLGFGRGNLRDSQMEQIADKGNGSYHYIDTVKEGCRVLVDKIGSSLVTVAKDVKIQVEFNPARVAAYRLIGYENRALAKEDFNNDTVDAGEVGSGHTVTALYEIAPIGVGFPAAGTVDPLRYGKDGKKKKPAPPLPDAQATDELMFVKARYKQPDGKTSTRIDHAVKDVDVPFAQASEDLRFAAAVAAFAMVLRNSQYKGLANFATIQDMAGGALGEDTHGLRAEFMELVEKARELSRSRR